VVPGAEADEIDALLDLADGVLLTGSPSNVHPSHFGETCTTRPCRWTRQRDAWTLPLVPRCWRAACRCWPSAAARRRSNVALGGTLHQAVHEVAGLCRPPRR
jgi:putative glutamine amidotransferase